MSLHQSPSFERMISMDENRIVELLTRKIAGEASAEELGELVYLLKKYPDAIYYEALLEQVWELGQKDSVSDLNLAFKKHKLKFKDDLKFKKSASGIKSLLRKPAFFVIAFVCIITGASFILNRYYQSDAKENIEIVAGSGVRKEIELPDGTLVSLNSESKLSYNPDMLKNEIRNVKLTGEALFNVAPDESHPFIVTTSKIAVKVLGTEFNIREYPGESRSETTLLTGSIELTINDRSDQKFLLKPSEKFALVKKGSAPATSDNNSVLMIETISPVKLGDKEYIQEISWAEDMLVFENETFEDLIPKLERWYNVKIDLNDSKIKSFRFTGIFIDENVVEALEAMKLVKPFNYKLNENQVKIY